MQRQDSVASKASGAVQLLRPDQCFESSIQFDQKRERDSDENWSYINHDIQVKTKRPSAELQEPWLQNENAIGKQDHVLKRSQREKTRSPPPSNRTSLVMSDVMTEQLGEASG